MRKFYSLVALLAILLVAPSVAVAQKTVTLKTSDPRLFHLSQKKRHIFPYPVHCESGNFLMLYVSNLSVCQNLIFSFLV